LEGFDLILKIIKTVLEGTTHGLLTEGQQRSQIRPNLGLDQKSKHTNNGSQITNSIGP